MNRRNFLKFLGALGLTTNQAFAIGHVFRKFPVKTFGHNHDIYKPTEYAFVADKFYYNITVIDINTGENVDIINFGFYPRVFEMARDDSWLAVGSPESPLICFYNLKTREATKLDLPAPVFQIFFVPQSKWVAVGLRNQVGMINYETWEIKIFPEVFDSQIRQVLWDSFYTLLFSSFSQSFWILEREKPLIHHKVATEPIEKPWETLNLSEYTKSGFGVSVASPEDDMLALTTYDGSEGLIYFPQEKRILKTGAMYTVGTTNRPMIAPYIDAYSGRVIFADVSGHVALFDFTAGDETPQRFEVDFSPRIIRTGWLERTWILGGDKALMFQSFDDPADRKIFRFEPEIVNMWVTGDGKTLLYLIDEDAPQLFRFDIRNREPLPPIRLYNIVMGGLIRMGSNNSICY